jgi:hypothetical protein
MALFEDVLSDLHSRKQAAIDALDFETAHSLYDEINERVAEHSRQSIASIRSSANLRLAQAHRAYRRRLETLVEEKRCLDARVFSQTEVVFEQTRDDHINQLIDLEKERGLALLSAVERPVPEQVSLLEQAKQSAVDSHFDEAITLRQQARDVGQAELERRRAEVEADFDSRKADLLARQKSELDAISDAHHRELDRLQREADERRGAANTEFAALARRIREEAEVQILSLKGETDLKAGSVGELREEMEGTLTEFEGLPPIRPTLARSEIMRVTALCPTDALKNAMPTEAPRAIVLRLHGGTAKSEVARMRGRPVSVSSTVLLTRAYTALGSRFARTMSASRG